MCNMEPLGLDFNITIFPDPSLYVNIYKTHPHIGYKQMYVQFGHSSIFYEIDLYVLSK